MPVGAIVQDASPQFPSGTTVSVYAARRFAGPAPAPAQPLPPGSPLTTAVVDSEGRLSVPAVLEEGAKHYAGALVAGVTQWRTFTAERHIGWVAPTNLNANLGVGAGFPIELHQLDENVVAIRGAAGVGTTIADKSLLFQVPAAFQPAKQAVLVMGYINGGTTPEPRFLTINTLGEAKNFGGTLTGAQNSEIYPAGIYSL